jgi:DNA-binding NarL/FixJ family response regulator
MLRDAPRPNGGKAVGQREVRILVLELDGGQARAALQAATDLILIMAESFEQASERLRSARAEAVVVALSAPGPNDPAALKELVNAARGIPVMLLSEPVAEEPTTLLLKAGISGYVLAQDARFLPTSVRELVRGGVPMSPPVSKLVLQRARRSSSSMAAVRPESAAAQNLLSARQREILALLQRGHSYDDIGVALGLSVNTVRSHLRIIYERLGAASKVEAVMIGMELGLLERARLA